MVVVEAVAVAWHGAKVGGDSGGKACGVAAAVGVAVK